MNTWKVLSINQEEEETSTFSKVRFGCTQAGLDLEQTGLGGERGARNVPMVEMYVELKLSSANRMIRHVLPTPLSPMSNSLKRKSYFFAIACNVL